jgi:hypothetical protein
VKLIVIYYLSLSATAEEVLLDFKELHGSHDGKNMADIVWRVLQTYGIAAKVRFRLTSSLMHNVIYHLVGHRDRVRQRAE